MARVQAVGTLAVPLTLLPLPNPDEESDSESEEEEEEECVRFALLLLRCGSGDAVWEPLVAA